MDWMRMQGFVNYTADDNCTFQSPNGKQVGMADAVWFEYDNR